MIDSGRQPAEARHIAYRGVPVQLLWKAPEEYRQQMSGSATQQAASLAMTPLTWALLVLLSLCWGGSFFFTGIAVTELPTFTIVALRVGLAALALWAVVLASATDMPGNLSFWCAIALMAMINSVLPFLLIVWGQSHVPSSLTSIFVATTPLFGVLLAHFMTADERITVPRVASVVCGFSGVVVLIGPGLLGDLGTDLLAQLAILGGALCYALSGIYGRRFSRADISPLVTATGQLTVSTVLLLPLALYIDQPWTLPMPSLAASAAVLGVALVSTAFAFLLYFRILATAGATNLMLVNFLVPVSAIMLGVSILNEALKTEHFIGMTLIFIGLALRDGKLLALIRRPA
jgi:drug/metabolite transporter (DMT)-like permease